MNNFLLIVRRRHSSLFFTVGVLMCVALQLVATMTAGAETALPLEGRWSGKIQIPGQELILVVDLARGASWNGSVTLPGLNVKGAPLTAINVQGDDISFGIQALTAPSVEPPKIQ